MSQKKAYLQDIESITAYFLNVTHMVSIVTQTTPEEQGNNVSDGLGYVSPEVQALITFVDSKASPKNLPVATKVSAILQEPPSTNSTRYVPEDVRVRSTEFRKNIDIQLAPLWLCMGNLKEQLWPHTAEAPVSILASITIIEMLLNDTKTLWEKDYQTLRSEIENIQRVAEGTYFQNPDPAISESLGGLEPYLGNILIELTPLVTINPWKSISETRPSL